MKNASGESEEQKNQSPPQASALSIVRPNFQGGLDLEI